MNSNDNDDLADCRLTAFEEQRIRDMAKKYLAFCAAWDRASRQGQCDGVGSHQFYRAMVEYRDVQWLQRPIVWISRWLESEELPG